MRRFFVVLHRWAGLAMTGFLVLVGLTGSLLAFLPELSRLTAPAFYVADTGQPRLDLASLAERAEALAPQAQVDSLWIGEHDQAQVSASPRTNPATGEPYTLGYDQLILNPFTGEELGRRAWGAISEGLHNLMPFIYQLHYELALGETGLLILGITALVWTLDCFVGFYLTLPAGRRNTALADSGPSAESAGTRKTYRQRWAPAWKIKWRGSAQRINFDLHRAGGLWLWAVLLVFAWSSVYMDLWDSVYTKVTGAVMEYHEEWTELPKRPEPVAQPHLTWREANINGETLMARAAATHSFTVERPISLRLDRERGVFIYVVRGSLDIQDHFGQTRVAFDADTGEERLVLRPTGQYAGNTVTTWLAALHMAHVFGMPYRIFVCVFGLALVMISVTGVAIWVQKRRAGRRVDDRLGNCAPMTEP